MDERTKRFILDILDSHNILTLATVRPDGWPQATTVSYVNDGLTIYVGVEPDCQKVRNIERCNKVSLTVDRDEADWNRIRALSMAATAEVTTDPAVLQKVLELMLRKFPQIKDLAESEQEAYVALRITPKVISILDYTKGFGHTELVEV